MADPDSPRPWTLESSEVERGYSIFTVRRDRARSPRTGKVHEFIVLAPSGSGLHLLEIHRASA